MTTAREPKLVDAATAAVYAGVARDTIHQWASRGRITRHGTPGRRLFDLRELAALLADTPQPTPAVAEPP